MDIINLIIKYITFPGTILKATVEQMTCRAKKIVIEDIRCFSKGSYCGHILHEPASSKRDAMAVCMRPLLVNFIIGLLILIPSSSALFFFENYSIANAVLFWAGISMWTNLFPQTGDSLLLTQFANGDEGGGWSRFVSTVMRFGSFLEKTGLSFLTSIIAALLLSQLVRIILPLFYTLISQS